ncbi:hypothetical protein HDU79_010408 [Rhizoclosmatium sp. JEL0117]|nr:hypothetical protein HDU79_010408 [Rhizoclosmatium sp. JEL0117]
MKAAFFLVAAIATSSSAQTVEVGGTCVSNADCKKGLLCSLAQYSPATFICAPAPTTNITFPGADVGEACTQTNDTECKAGLKCFQSKCTWVLSGTDTSNEGTGTDCATYQYGYPKSCKPGLLCILPPNSPDGVLKPNILSGSCISPPAAGVPLPSVTVPVNGAANWDGCISDDSGLCNKSEFAPGAVAQWCKANATMWGSPDPSPLYVCHVIGSAPSVVVSTVQGTAGAVATSAAKTVAATVVATTTKSSAMLFGITTGLLIVYASIL